MYVVLDWYRVSRKEGGEAETELLTLNRGLSLVHKRNIKIIAPLLDDQDTSGAGYD